ncbi:MAG: hypothetical protein ACI9US_000925 [Gammaproteobacteria bacterium]
MERPLKISRNAICPCGSGQKFKHCCLGADTVERKPTPQSQELFNAVHAQAAAHPFESIDDVQAFANQQMQAQNDRGVDDFEGLSPAQMGALLGQLPGREKVVQLASLTEAASAPIVHLFELLIVAIGEKGLKATATGNLPRQFCRDAALSFLGEEGYAKRTRYGGINTEPDFSELHVMRTNAEFAGLIEIDRGRFKVTGKGSNLLEKESYAGVYLPLLDAFVNEYNWSYRDGYEELHFIQQSWMFTLWLLHCHGGEERELQFYEEKYLRAFPILLEQVDDSPYREPIETVKSVYGLRTFHRFLVLFDLVEIRKHDPVNVFSECSVKAGRLFSGVVRFLI